VLNVVFSGKPPFSFGRDSLVFLKGPKNCMRIIQDANENEIQLTLGEGGGMEDRWKNADGMPWRRKVSYVA